MALHKIVSNDMTYYHTKCKAFITNYSIFTQISTTRTESMLKFCSRTWLVEKTPLNISKFERLLRQRGTFGSFIPLNGLKTKYRRLSHGFEQNRMSHNQLRHFCDELTVTVQWQCYS